MKERESIRMRLRRHTLSYVWLINQLRMRGIITDKTEMSSVMSGVRIGTKADSIIQTAGEILDDYEKGSVLVGKE